MSIPYRMWEILERSNTGPQMDEDDFLPKVFAPKLQEVIKKYEIKADLSKPVPADDDLADRVWEAAWELFREVGTYNTDTHRIIKVTDEEIKEALYMEPGQYLVGANKEAKLWKHRSVEDTEPPFCITSGDITVDEQDHLSLCLAYMKEPLCDGHCAPILEETNGMKIMSASPSEINACTQHIYNMRLAAKLVGRPGMFFVAVGTAEHDSGQIAVSNNEWGVRQTDTRIIGSLTEFKTADTLLNRVVHCNQYGCFAGNLTGAIYGGWCGGAEGVAVATAAYNLNGLLVYGSIFNQCFPFHLNWGTNTTRELLWPIAVAGQAMARNTKRLYTSNGFCNAGPMTKMVFYETAAHAIASTISGWHLWEMASARNKYKNRATPMEARIGMEAGHAVARQGMTRDQANEIVNKLLAKYEDQAATAPMGSTYQECYDVARSLPTQKHYDMFREVKDEIHAMGVEFLY